MLVIALFYTFSFKIFLLFSYLFFLLSSGSDASVKAKRTPRKSHLYYMRRRERRRHEQKVAELQSEIASLRALVDQQKNKNGDGIVEAACGSGVNTAGSKADANKKDVDKEKRTGKRKQSKGEKIKLYKLMTKKIRRLPINRRINLAQKLTSPKKLKVNRVAKRFATDLGLDPRSVRTINKGRLQRTAKSEANKQRVLAFLQLPDHSVVLPGKRDTVTIQGKKVQKVVLLQFLAPLWREYNTLHPANKVGITFFKQVRKNAKFIKLLRYHKTAVCLCMRHQNYALKLRSLRAANIPVVPDSLVNQYTEDTLKTKLESADLPEMLTYVEWKRVEHVYGDPDNPKVTKKLKPVELTRPRGDVIAEVLGNFTTISQHINRANAQHREIRGLRNRISSQECTVQMDFAENWNVNFSEEVQSAYYAKDAITVHPAVVHVAGDDGPRAHSYCIVSDDRQHDAPAIMAILAMLTEQIKKDFPAVKTIHYCSDSPSSQYRNISMFSIICKHLELFGIACTWSYFEAGHGKGPCDGVGAAAKRKADDTIKQGHNIQSAEEFVAMGNDGGSVTYLHLPVAATYKARKELPTIVSSRTVPGTMQVHAVVVVDQSGIATRETSCYNSCCWNEGKPVLGCPGWRQHMLYPENTTSNKPPVAKDSTLVSFFCQLSDDVYL